MSTFNMTKGYRRLSAVVCLGLFFAGAPIFAEDPAHLVPFTMPSARYGALGGSHVAYSKGFYSILYNPAAYAKMPKIIGILELTFSVFSNKNLAKVGGAVSTALDEAQDKNSTGISSSLSNVLKELENLGIGVDLGGPISAGYIGNGLGIGVFNRVHADASLAGLSAKATINADVWTSGGYAMRVLDIGSHTLDVGLAGKIFYRFSVDPKVRFLSLFSSSMGNDSSSAVSFPAVSTIGFGFDLGTQYTWANSLTAALVWRDLVSPAFRSSLAELDKGGNFESMPVAFVHPNLDIGVAYKVPIPYGDLNLMFDFRDLTDMIVPQGVISRNPLLNIGFGAEYILWNMLFLRMGIGDALPALGIGVKLKALEIDFAARGKEMGLDPGVRPVWVLDLGFLIRL